MKWFWNEILKPVLKFSIYFIGIAWISHIADVLYNIDANFSIVVLFMITLPLYFYFLYK